MSKLSKLALVLVLFSSSVAFGQDKLSHSEQRQMIEAVKSKLIDPDSAKIRLTKMVTNTFCGLVNSKNSLGGYVGDRWFVGTINYPSGQHKNPEFTIVIYEDPEFDPIFCKS